MWEDEVGSRWRDDWGVYAKSRRSILPDLVMGTPAQELATPSVREQRTLTKRLPVGFSQWRSWERRCSMGRAMPYPESLEPYWHASTANPLGGMRDAASAARRHATRRVRTAN